MGRTTRASARLANHEAWRGAMGSVHAVGIDLLSRRVRGQLPCGPCPVRGGRVGCGCRVGVDAQTCGCGERRFAPCFRGRKGEGREGCEGKKTRFIGSPSEGTASPAPSARSMRFQNTGFVSAPGHGNPCAGCDRAGVAHGCGRAGIGRALNGLSQSAGAVLSAVGRPLHVAAVSVSEIAGLGAVAGAFDMGLETLEELVGHLGGEAVDQARA